MQPIASHSSTPELPRIERRIGRRFTRLQKFGRWLRRMAFLVHRWLGIALALLMAVWAISGIVMMYVSFPETTADERLTGLAPLDLSRCCERVDFPRGPIDAAVVEMVGGEPVLRWSGPEGAGSTPLGGAGTSAVTLGTAEAVAQGHFRRVTGDAAAASFDIIDRDQWTVYGRFRDHAPLYKASFADQAGTVLYVSGATGEVVQDTTRHERFWNWLGAVPHWLYFTAFRELQPLWYNFIVYASLLGIFLTVTGIYIGFRMYGRGKRSSPFRGIALWHHWTGLIFGIVTLTWVLSGLASMQPWGWLESRGPREERAALAGRAPERADAEALVLALETNPQPGVVSAELSVQGGERYAVLARADGSRFRATLPGLEPALLSPTELGARARAAKPGTPIASAELIRGGDAYHYSHHNAAILPAFRVIYANEDETRIYLDPRTGELIGFADAPARAYRWWHYGLHRLDFAELNARPLWDIVMLPLIAGISLLCILGMWMGVRRLRTNFRRNHLTENTDASGL
jgi:uncharacterized iron-regulated membrane protein